MAGLLHGSGSVFKSPLRVQAVFLRRSRDCQRAKRCLVEQQLEKLGQDLRQRDREISKLRVANERYCSRIELLEAETRQLRQQEPMLRFEDPPVGQHGYGARMIALAIELAQSGIGLRAIQRALKIVFAALGIVTKVPHWTTIRLWLLRLGCGVLSEKVEENNDWVWLMDHSVQIGQEKVLVVHAIRAANLPPAGTAIHHEHIRPLAVVPRISWTQKEVYDELTNLAQQQGVPRAIVTDHGVDLLGGIRRFQKDHPEVIELSDFKHHAACRLKALLNNDARFKQFQAQVGHTRSAIQQTEAGFLNPPAPKPKARFMNLGPQLAWAQSKLQLLDHPNPKTLEFVSRHRLKEKLGWLREFRAEVPQWLQLQQVANAGIAFANEQGVFPGADQKLRAALPADLKHPASRQLADQLVEFVAGEQAKLKPGERLPLSTEIVESTFGRYKQLEDQHAKQGFTGLILAFAALLTKVTLPKIRATFATTLVRDTRDWIRNKLGITFAAKRSIANHDCKSSRCATKGLQPV